MTILTGLLLTIEAVCSILLIGIILLQKGKGGGLGLAFGGGTGESLFGSRAGNVLTKATVALAIIFMVNTVGLAIIFARSHDATLIDTQAAPASGAQPEAAHPDAETPPQQQLPAAPPEGGMVPEADPMQQQQPAPVEQPVEPTPDRPE